MFNKLHFQITCCPILLFCFACRRCTGERTDNVYLYLSRCQSGRKLALLLSCCCCCLKVLLASKKESADEGGILSVFHNEVALSPSEMLTLIKMITKIHYKRICADLFWQTKCFRTQFYSIRWRISQCTACLLRGVVIILKVSRLGLGYKLCPSQWPCRLGSRGGRKKGWRNTSPFVPRARWRVL